MVSLTAYFKRLGLADDLSGTAPADLGLLKTLIDAHTRSIPFENLDSLLRISVPLDLASIENKLVLSARGGYCFEQNTYFATVLEQLGYQVERLAARVVWGSSANNSSTIPRAHMVLLVTIGEHRYLCDVGFGGLTPTGPLHFVTETEQVTPHEKFRLVDYKGQYLLQALPGNEWRDVYLFDLQRQSAIDYEVANHYVSTHANSHFRHTLMIARAFPGGRYSLLNRRLTTFDARGEKHEQVAQNAAELVEFLREFFGISVPDADAFAAALDHIRE